MACCTKHLKRDAVATCADCGEPWCELCIVPARKKQPVRCVECALIAAGVRPRQKRRIVEPVA